MKIDQVISLLGQPTLIEEAETTGAVGQVYEYISKQGSGRITFVNGTVFTTKFVSAGAAKS